MKENWVVVVGMLPLARRVFSEKELSAGCCQARAVARRD
jgi:hypothetical protein